MKSTIVALLSCLLYIAPVHAQFPIGDKWYNNPLGFSPLNLHTSMSFLLPAAIVGTVSLISKKDTSITNRLNIYNESGTSWGYKFPYTLLSQNNTGVDYQLRKWLSIGTEFSVYFTKDGFNNATGISIRPFARFYAINSSRYRLYFESGGGLIYFFDQFPKATSHDARIGTRLNGNTKYGIGGEVSIYRSVSFTAGLRHVHISNGDTKGSGRNPSHDSNGFFLGVTFNR